MCCRRKTRSNSRCLVSSIEVQPTKEEECWMKANGDVAKPLEIMVFGLEKRRLSPVGSSDACLS